MKKLFYTLATLLLLTGCDLVFNKPGADPPQKQPDSIPMMDSIALKSGPGITDDFVFLFRIPANDPEDDNLQFSIVSQTVRGMFSVNAFGDMFITRSKLNDIQNWYGKNLIVVVAVSDGVNTSKAEFTFKVEKTPDGSHYLKRNIA